MYLQYTRIFFVAPFIIALGASAAACKPGLPPDPGVETTKAHDRERITQTFDHGEDEILRDLSAIDRRLAQRANVIPSEEDLNRVALAAVLREDPTVAVIDGSIDPFSFDARGRGLESAKQKADALPSFTDDRARMRERELLVRLIESELLRLDEERGLPRSASALVRAIVETWHDPKDEREAGEMDRWLARRLTIVRDSISAQTDPSSARALDVVRARALDDDLDALEHLTSVPGFTQTTQQLVLVREALEAAGSKPAAKAQSSWESLSRRVRAQLGIVHSPDRLSLILLALESELHARADRALTAAHVARDTLSVEKQVMVVGECVDALPGSRVRSMAAPHEREAACHLRHLIARIEDEPSRAIALATMHDHIVVAEWALDVARGVATIAETQGKHHLFVPVLPDTRARYERIALARPIAAPGAAEAIRILVIGDRKLRATFWTSTIGDVPLDIAARELGDTGARPAN